MILTGKCKGDFLKSKIGSEVILFESMLPIYQNALIIEWLDSIKYSKNTSLWSYCFGNYDVFKDNWNEHIEKAIIKANKIYNERNII